MVDHGQGSIINSEITIVHVDDDPDFVETAAIWLERELDRAEVLTATSTTEALEQIDSTTDCVVSDFDMPEVDGLEFLDQVRETHPDIPFVLFTGKGSEEIASEAIGRGVTDYIQKQFHTDVYTVLANRIENAVRAYRASKAAEETRKRYEKLIEHASDIIFVVDPDGTFRYLSAAVVRVLGYTPEELVGDNGFSYIHPDDREEVIAEFERVVADPTVTAATRCRTKCADGSWARLELRGRNQMDDPHIGGIVVVGRDIAARDASEHE